MSTLVVCVDRDGTIAAAAGSSGPIVGRETIRDLVTEVGIDDPEDSCVNCLLEALSVARDLDDEDSVVAVVTGENPTTDGGSDARSTGSGIVASRTVERVGSETAFRADEKRRTDRDRPTDAERHVDSRPTTESNDRGTVGVDRVIARQVDALVSRCDPDAAIVVTDTAEDERLVPIVESRVRVDAVDRVVVRQARDIESAYYLLKQFLADEQLRGTVLVPIGLALLVFPLLLALTDRPATALAAIAGVTGFFLLYKGLGVDDLVGTLAGEVREALYSGQVSIVTYVVAEAAIAPAKTPTSASPTATT